MARMVGPPTPETGTVAAEEAAGEGEGEEEDEEVPPAAAGPMV